MVFTIPIGVLSVGVVPRPTVPNTCSTSGTFRSNLSCTWSSRVASVIDMPGGDVAVCILDHHDRGIDENTNRERQAAERHDVRGDVEVIHRDEGGDDGD